MIWLQLTANTGPAECCLGVAKALERLRGEALALGVAVTLLDDVAGPAPRSTTRQCGARVRRAGIR